MVNICEQYGDQNKNQLETQNSTLRNNLFDLKY